MNIKDGLAKIFNSTTFGWLADIPENQGTLGAWITKCAQKGGDPIAISEGDFMSLPLCRAGRITERTMTLTSAFLVAAAVGTSVSPVAAIPVGLAMLMMGKYAGLLSGFGVNAGVQKAEEWAWRRM